jgi:hypothetical protein
MAFVLQNSAAGADALGGTGGRIGYDTIGNSLAIEFDSLRNPTDIGVNTIAVAIDGNWQNEQTEAPAGFDMNNGVLHYAWVDYDGGSDTLKVYLSTSSTKPASAKLTTQIALDQIVGSSAYVGFSAGNYDQPDYHRVFSWTYSTDAPPPDGLQLINLQVPQDVNRDGRVSALDVALIVNRLSNTAEGESRSDDDVNGDNRVTAADALAVINYLAEQNSQGLDELEAAEQEPQNEPDDDDVIRLLAEDVAMQLDKI